MKDIRGEARKLFRQEDFCREIPGEFDASFTVQGKLPQFQEIGKLFEGISARDSMKLVFTCGHEQTEVKSASDREGYENFDGNVTGEDRTNVHILITKGIKDNVRSVYCLEKFLEFFTAEGDDTKTRLMRWNEIVRESKGRTAFEIFDEKAEFHAGAFIFTNDAAGFDPETDEREKLAKLAGGASFFMERREIKLLPGDFAVDSMPPKGKKWLFEALAASMRKLDAVMSLIYIGASSRIEGSEVVLSVTRGGKELHFPMDDIPENAALSELAGWILGGEDAAERADVARNTVSILCRDEEQLLHADTSLTDAVRSAYNLYRRKNVDRYIEVRKLLNQSILDSAKKVEELIGALIDGFKTNFIAVITVVISKVLSGHIDLNKIGRSELVNPEFKAVVLIFVVASSIYLVSTLVFIFFKWDFYQRYYRQVKGKFSGLLDQQELARETSEADKIKKEADLRLSLYCLVMTLLWAALLAAVWCVGSRL